MSRDSKIFLFVFLSFLFTVPTWWIHLIKDDNLHFFIWDFSLLACKSLIPMMGYFLVENKLLRTIFVLYFGLTLFNLADTLLMYFLFIGVWAMMLKIIFAGLIVLYLTVRLWEDRSAL
jgi:hypothetical protein